MKKLFACLIFCMLLTSCGANDWVLKVDNIKVTENEFNFYLSSIKEQLSGTELETEEDWQTKDIEGKKAIDVAKQRAMDIAKQNAEYIVLAKKAGLKLTDADKNQIKQMKDSVVQNYGGEKGYKEFLTQNSISDDFIAKMCESTVYYDKIAQKVAEENPVTNEEIQRYFDAHRSEVDSEIRKAKHILLLTADPESGVSLSDEEAENKKKLADELFERAKNGEDFDALMNEYTEDPGTKTNPNGYIFGSGEMVPEFEQATDSIGYDELTLCESQYGYHIIKRLPLELGEISDKLKSMLINEKVEKWIADAEKEYSLEVKTNEK